VSLGVDRVPVLEERLRDMAVDEARRAAYLTYADSSSPLIEPVSSSTP
jgi:hypothetical protein